MTFKITQKFNPEERKTDILTIIFYLLTFKILPLSKIKVL